MTDAIEALCKIQLKERKEAEVTQRLLALCLSKPLETFSALPDWPKCVHVDIEIATSWPDLERELLPMVNNLSGHLAHKELIPTDFCIVRAHGRFCLVARHD